MVDPGSDPQPVPQDNTPEIGNPSASPVASAPGVPHGRLEALTRPRSPLGPWFPIFLGRCPKISRTSSGRFRIINMEKAVLPGAPFASVPESFLFFGRTGPPPRRDQTTRLEPCPPGGCWQRNGPQRDPFFGKAPPGPRRRYGVKWPGGAMALLAPWSSGPQLHHRARLLDCSEVLSGIFFRGVKARGSESDGQVSSLTMGETWSVQETLAPGGRSHISVSGPGLGVVSLVASMPPGVYPRRMRAASDRPAPASAPGIVPPT
jgi:hypothetical protein